jgi:hypothetical protein
MLSRTEPLTRCASAVAELATMKAIARMSVRRVGTDFLPEKTLNCMT